MAGPIFLIDEDVTTAPGTNGHANGANGAAKSNGGSDASCDVASSLFELDLLAYTRDFNERVVSAYNEGDDDRLPADISVARSLIPAGTGVLRDFSYIAPEIPEFDHNFSFR